jgi:HSP20 family molecular chaperone IbpA
MTPFGGMGMNQLTAPFGRSSMGSQQMDSLGSILRADVVENNNSYEIHVDVPGVCKDDLDITLTENTLTIRGKTCVEKEVENDNYHRKERFSGTVNRVIPLPSGSNWEKATSSLVNGVLSVTLPKDMTSRGSSRKLEITDHPSMQVSPTSNTSKNKRTA